MQSVGRVGCVRIPRFPIGAVWRQHDPGEQLALPLATATAAATSALLSPPTPRSATSTPASPSGGGSPRSSSEPADRGPHWDAQPRALATGPRLTVVTAAAARSGVRAGMTVAEARALCAGIEIRPWDERTIVHAVSRLTVALLAAAPQVTPVEGAPGSWWIGAEGFEGLGGERALARTVLAIARRWHPRARVAIAGSCVVARAATWEGAGRSPDGDGGLVLVPHGADAPYLATVPLALLPMDAELRETLGALGIRTAGELAALPAEDVERRWGATGLASWRLAQGEDRRRAWLARHDAPRTAQADLPAPSDTMEPVLFLLQGALGRLARELEGEGRAAAIVTVTLALDRRSALPSGGPPHTISREARLARPSARAEVLLEHCRGLLERWTLPAPVTGVAVAITATARGAGSQGELLATGRRDDAAASAAAARLAGALGGEAVVRPVARDAHAPERAGAWVPVDEETPEPLRAAAVPPPSAAGETRALRLLDPPEAVEVEHAAGIPCAMWWRGARQPLLRVRGPERLSGDWWRDDAYARDYWRCESETGVMVLFQNRAGRGSEHPGPSSHLPTPHASGPTPAVRSDDWFVHGWYD